MPGRGALEKLVKSAVSLGAGVGILLNTGCETASNTNAAGTGAKAIGAFGKFTPAQSLGWGLFGDFLQNNAQIQSHNETARKVVDGLGGKNIPAQNSPENNEFRFYVATVWKDRNGDGKAALNEFYGDPAQIYPSNKVYVICEYPRDLALKNWRYIVTDSNGNDLVDKIHLSGNVPSGGAMLTFGSFTFKPDKYRIDFHISNDSISNLFIGKKEFVVKYPSSNIDRRSTPVARAHE